MRISKGITVLLFGLLFSAGIVRAQQKFAKVHGTQFKLECQQCHSTTNWQVNPNKINFEHASTGFTLKGAHIMLRCRDCHRDLVFSHVGTQCADCHTDIHKGMLGQRCDRCHSALSWENRTEMNEAHQQTRFPLFGAHAALDCQSCHHAESPNEYALKNTDCQSCHLDDYLRTLNPAHKNAGFDLNCDQCHSIAANSWQQTSYAHTAGFPLNGGHSGLQCNDCHSAGFRTVSSACVSCHESDYNKTSDPNHKIFGFPTNCEQCHTTNDWQRGPFDHLSVSGFALNGAHANTDIVKCTDCHVNNQLTGLPRDCYGCHQKNFEAVSDPNHVLGNFPHDCTTCHSEEAWSPATFDHNQTNFPLTGAHQTTDCASCHSNGYTNTPMECVACHRQNYDATTDPNHASANFPTTCQDCHSTSAWSPANWDHDNQYFPIYSGKHKGEWNVCTDCHTNTSDYAQFSCFAGCHEHNQSKMDDEHKDVADYVYESNACYSCHPQGDGYD